MSRASSKAFEAIRSRIISGEFAPGTHLKEEELAEVCGVSRTPIRDALRSLAAEDYVNVVPNHGTFVTKWSRDDIRDIFTLRAMLEGYAAQLGAELVTIEHIEELADNQQVVADMLKRGDTLDHDMLVISNRRFHEIIIEAAGSPRLTQMIARLTEQPLTALTTTSDNRAGIERSNRQHGELIDAFRARDASWARAVVESHILAAYQAYKQRYETSPDSDTGTAAE